MDKLMLRIEKEALACAEKSCLLQYRQNPVNGAKDRALVFRLPPGYRARLDRFDESLRTLESKFLEAFGELAEPYETAGFLGRLYMLSTLLRQEQPATDLKFEAFKDIFFEEIRHELDQTKRQISELRLRRNQKMWGRTPYASIGALTLGVEEEYKLVDKASGRLFDPGEGAFNSFECDGIEVSREIYRAQVEAKTGVCENADQIYNSLKRGRSELEAHCAGRCALISTGTHPISQWENEQVHLTSHANDLINDLQDVMRRNLISGCHVHVGVEQDREMAQRVVNGLIEFLPLLLALSTNSPMWAGRLTGLRSYRKSILSELPRSGLPPRFRNKQEYDEYVKRLTRSSQWSVGEAFNPTMIWWDVRLHPVHDTIEVRICDAFQTVLETAAFAALIQALVAALVRQAFRGHQMRESSIVTVEENIWRASRLGRHSRFIDSRFDFPRSIYAVYRDVLEFIEPELKLFGSRELVEDTFDRIFRKGTGAERQISVYRDTGKPARVVEHLRQSFTQDFSG